MATRAVRVASVFPDLELPDGRGKRHSGLNARALRSVRRVTAKIQWPDGPGRTSCGKTDVGHVRAVRPISALFRASDGQTCGSLVKMTHAGRLVMSGRPAIQIDGQTARVARAYARRWPDGPIVPGVQAYVRAVRHRLDGPHVSPTPDDGQTARAVQPMPDGPHWVHRLRNDRQAFQSRSRTDPRYGMLISTRTAIYGVGWGSSGLRSGPGGLAPLEILCDFYGRGIPN